MHYSITRHPWRYQSAIFFGFMAMNLAQVVSYSAFKIRREHFHVALTAAPDRLGWWKCRFSITPWKARNRATHGAVAEERISALLPIILKTKQETTHDLNCLGFVNTMLVLVKREKEVNPWVE
jgi:hypothetical protein